MAQILIHKAFLWLGADTLHRAWGLLYIVTVSCIAVPLLAGMIRRPFRGVRPTPRVASTSGDSADFWRASLLTLGIVLITTVLSSVLDQPVFTAAADDARMAKLAHQQLMLVHQLLAQSTSPSDSLTAADSPAEPTLRQLEAASFELELLLQRRIPPMPRATAAFADARNLEAKLAAIIRKNGDPAELRRLVTARHQQLGIVLQSLESGFQAPSNSRLRWGPLLPLMAGIAACVLLVRPAIQRARARAIAFQADKDERERLALVAWTSTDPVVLTDNDALVTWINPAFARLTAATHDNVRGRTLAEILCREKLALGDCQPLDEVIRRGETLRTELASVGPDGERRVFELDLHGALDAAGRRVGAVATCHDVTAQVTAREQLATQLRHIDTAEASAALGHWVWVPDEQRIEWSRQLFELHRRNPADGPPDFEGVLQLYCPQSSQKLREAVERTLRDGTPYCVVLRLADAEERYLEAFGTPQRNAAGAITGLAGTVRDITERLITQRRLMESQDRYRQLADSIPAMTWLSGPDARGTDYNRAWLEFRGRTMEEELGQGWMNGLHPDDRASCLRAFRTAFDSRQPYSTAYRLQRHDGVYRWMDARGIARYGADGEFLGYAGGCIDVTERVEAARALNAAHSDLETYRKIIDQHALVAETDPEGCFEFVNDAFCRITGHSRSELLGTQHRHLLPGSRFLRRWLEMTRTVKQGRVWHGEVCLQRRQGGCCWLDTTIAPLYEADGQLRGYFAVQSDITALKESQQSLHESEEFLERAGQVAGVGGWDLDLQTMQPRWTLQTRRIHEVDDDYQPTLEEAVAFYGPGAREQIQAVVETAFRDGTPWDLELPFVTARGRSIWVRSAGQAEFKNGKAVRLYGAFQDITQRKLAELEVERTSVLLEGVLAAASEFSIVAVDPEGVISVFNRGAERMLGYAAEEVVGQLTPAVFHRVDEMEEQAVRLAEECGRKFTGIQILMGRLESQAMEQREWTYVRKDGTQFPVSLVVTAMRTVDGQLLGYLGVGQDITERKRSEISLLATNRQLEVETARASIMAEKADEASRLKSEFLANMSHEIRTPMTAILGYADLLAESDGLPVATGERQDYIGTIRRNGEHLLALINDILDLSKIEAGKMTIERIPTSPRLLLQEVDLLMQVKARAKGITLATLTANPLPSTIPSDPLRLKQILVNLVSNAIKFTEAGSVTVTASLVKSSESISQLQIAVADTGVGMTPEQISRLFEAFQQVDSSSTRRFGGSGLGLRISQRLANLLEGKITVTSSPGVGSTFTLVVAIPGLDDAPTASLNSDERAATPATAPTSLAGLRVLLAEDGPDNQRLVTFHLRRVGAIVEVVENGLQALDLLLPQLGEPTEVANLAGFDLLVTDLQMPVLDGLNLVRRLRQAGSRLPILALTAHAMGGDEQRCLAAGCDAYVPKPIDRQLLLTAIGKAISRRQSPAESLEAP